jgi:hypothetical protein
MEWEIKMGLAWPATALGSDEMRMMQNKKRTKE